MWPAWARAVAAPLFMRPVAAPHAPWGARVCVLLRRRRSSLAAYIAILLLYDMVRTWQMGLAAASVMVVLPLWAMAGVAAVVPVLVEATGRRGLRLAACMTVATFAATGLLALSIDRLHAAPLATSVSAQLTLSNAAFLLRGWWLYSVAGLLFAAWCQTREREQAALGAAREAELERAHAQRQIVASRLKVLQARVEPELLFDALAGVRDAYLHDPAAADTLLDDLVTYLRAALPHMRGGASTLAREATLAAAYLRVVPAGRERRLQVEVDVPRECADLDFPPMVLLPLVHAMADAQSACVQIDAACVASVPATRRVSVRLLAARRPRGWSDEALHVVRETLGHYLGEGAALHVGQEGQDVVATVSWRPADLPAARPFPPFAPPGAVLSVDSSGSSRTS